MSYEIEAKIKVPGHEPVIEKLKEQDAEFVHEVRQVDTYFMDTHKLLKKNDCGLRIRQEFTQSRHSAVITFKGARSQSRYKSRPEYETGIANAEVMAKIFESLGYAKRLTFEKKRTLWQLDGCSICLDQLPRLGCFVEVEGPDEETISGVLDKLNLAGEPHISSGYASLMEDILKTDDLQPTEIFLSEGLR